MGFEIVEPGVLCTADPLPEGMVSIAKAGKLTARAADLAIAGIEDRAAVLVDRETWRIALRAARDGEQKQSMSVTTIPTGKGRRDSGRRSINVARAVRALALEPAAIAGRYDLVAKGSGREALLIVNLMPPTVGHKEKAAK